MPIEKDNKKRNWAEKIDQKEVELYKKRLNIWTNVYHWRKYRWLSQSQLSEQSGLTQAIISNLEKWEYNPSLDVLTKLSAALNIPFEVLTKSVVPWKMLEVVDYILQKLKNLDVLKAMKLLYFIDLEATQNLGNKIVGINYYRWHYGPFNNEIYILDSIYNRGNKKDFSTDEYFHKNLVLTSYEKKFIDKVLDDYGDKDAIELMDMSYDTQPMEGYEKWDNNGMGNLVF